MIQWTFVRFILVGVINTIVGLGTMFVLLDGVHLGYWISSFIGNSLGAVVSYFLNRHFTFENHISMRKSGFRFVLAILICYFVSYKISKTVTYYLLLRLGLTSGHWALHIAVLLGSGFYTLSNYFAQKKYVFPKPMT